MLKALCILRAETLRDTNRVHKEAGAEPKEAVLICRIIFPLRVEVRGVNQNFFGEHMWAEMVRLGYELYSVPWSQIKNVKKG
jgi:hypothetical protein